MSETMSIGECIEKNGIYIGPTRGTSMLPMLKEKEDTVVIAKKTGRLKKYDVALHKRNDDYVLHRVIKVKDAGYFIRGDNCLNKEYVKEEDVIGVLTEFYNGKEHAFCSDKKYLRYAKRAVRTHMAKFLPARIRGVLRGLLGL